MCKNKNNLRVQSMKEILIKCKNSNCVPFLRVLKNDLNMPIGEAHTAEFPHFR